MKRETEMRNALLVGVALVLMGFVVFGRYTTATPAYGVGIYTVDRFTGVVALCNANGCRDLTNNPPASAPAPQQDY